ncbi:MAG: nucleotidyltransferase family protein [candidate division KSB1 bacterium]|nr:nucleotidyltransferase family protein [candidate division KSB1 bacterium]MDZ7399598.1 nucleotidyltransferase family protein [candidate division KSB1 bacterium]
MEIQPDFRDLLELFNAHKVEYMVVGGYALAFHGAPRFTGDLDIFVKPSPENAKRILSALDEFGFGSVGLSLEDLEYPDKVVQLGFPPVRIDIITSITGVTWEEAFSNCVEGKYGDVVVRYIGLDDFIKNKRSMGRKKDQADLEALGED